MWVTASPNPTYGSSISRCYSMNLKSWISLPQMQLFDILWQSVRTSAPAIIQLYGVLHPLSHSSFSSHVTPWHLVVLVLFLQRNFAFWGDLFVNFQNISHFIFRLIEPLWLIMWVSVVARWYFKCILLQRVISFAFTCGLRHCCVCSNAVQTELWFPRHQFLIVCSLGCEYTYPELVT